MTIQERLRGFSSAFTEDSDPHRVQVEAARIIDLYQAALKAIEMGGCGLGAEHVARHALQNGQRLSTAASESVSNTRAAVVQWFRDLSPAEYEGELEDAPRVTVTERLNKLRELLQDVQGFDDPGAETCLAASVRITELEAALEAADDLICDAKAWLCVRPIKTRAAHDRLDDAIDLLRKAAP